MRHAASWCLVLGATVAWTAVSTGQTQPSGGKPSLNDTARRLREATSSSPLMWDVQTVIDGYVRHMTRWYDLTEKQEQYTRELMTQRVKQFLKDYEKDARVLFGEYYEYQMRGEMPSPEAAREFAHRAGPLAAAIRQEILDGNMQWRRILNEDQIRKHDQDLNLMKAEFDRFDQMFERWNNGDVRPRDVGIRETQLVARTVDLEEAMKRYVVSFISRYNLDKGQQETAQSLLREAREEAARYREAHKQRFEEIAAQEKVLMASNPKNDPEELTRARAAGQKLIARKLELEKPLNEDVFNRLKKRLEDIPTADQRKQEKARQEALLARVRTATRPAADTRPAAEKTTAAAPTTAPAVTQ